MSRDGGRGTRIMVPGQRPPGPAAARARRGQVAAAVLMAFATMLAGISVFEFDLALAVLIALATTVTYVVSLVALLRGRTGLGTGLALGVGVVSLASNVSLLSFRETDAYYMLNLVACVAAAVAGVVAALTCVPEGRVPVNPTWLVVLGIAVVGSIVAMNLPWLRITIPGQAGQPTVVFDCCAAYRSDDWGLATDVAQMLAVTLLLGRAALRGVTPRTVGVSIGVALAGLAALISTLYQGLNYIGESLLPAIWLAVGVLVLLLAVALMEAGRLAAGAAPGKRPAD